MEEKLNDQMLIRRGKLEKIAALGFEPYGGKYECTHHSEDIHADAAALEASGEHVKVAGRIMIIRGHGKTAFCTLRDEKGDIQLYFRKDTVSENEWTSSTGRHGRYPRGGRHCIQLHTREKRPSVSCTSPCFPSLSARFRKSGTALRIRNSATARDILTLSPIPK